MALYDALDRHEPLASRPIGEDARFLFEGLQPGGSRLRVALSGFEPLELAVDLPVGATAELGELELVAVVEVEPVSGVAQRQGVEGHGGILVETVGRPFATVTGSDGQLRLALAPDVSALRFTASGYSAEELSDHTSPPCLNGRQRTGSRR